MKVRITAGGIYDGKGVEVPIGTVVSVQKEPSGWAGRYETVDDDAETTVDANNEDPNDAAAQVIKAQAEPVAATPARKLTAAEKKAIAAAEPAAPPPPPADATPVAETTAETAVPAPAPAVGLQPWQQS